MCSYCFRLCDAEKKLFDLLKIDVIRSWGTKKGLGCQKLLARCLRERRWPHHNVSYTPWTKTQSQAGTCEDPSWALSPMPLALTTRLRCLPLMLGPRPKAMGPNLQGRSTKAKPSAVPSPA